MNVKKVDKFIEDKTNEFIISLNKRYQEHVSDTFIKAYILGEFTHNIKNNKNISLKQAAYDSCVYLFESLLEHGCSVISNGHHVAQNFSSYFMDETIEYEKKDILIEVKNSVKKYVSEYLSKDENEFYLREWFCEYFLDKITVKNWIKIKGEDEKYLEDLDLENFEILEITNEYLLFCAGGDWQNPHKVKMFYLENDTYEVEDVSEGFERGLSEELFAKILGFKYDDNKETIILND